MKIRRYAHIASLIALSSCGILPASGPYSSDMGAGVPLNMSHPDGKPQTEFRFATAEINEPLLKRLPEKLAGTHQEYLWPAPTKSPFIGISVGDRVAITIYESGSGGLFIPAEAGVRPGNFVSIPEQTVDQAGTLTIPFAGDILVEGRTPVDVSKEISEKLGSRALEPQAVVSITDRVGAEASVIGEVNRATKFSLGLSGEKILDAIARAEGPRFPGFETNVNLQRSGKEWTIPFDLLVEDPTKNIYLKPKDTIYLYREPKSFQVYGAAGATGSYNFGKRTLTLSEALGLARGLEDGMADPEEIYLYREEKLDELLKIGVNIPKEQFPDRPEKIPTIYKLNLRKSAGFFLAQQFPMEDKDIVYIANAEAVEFVKFLQLLNPTVTTKINTQSAVQQ